mmetsp:Transcript_20031/g.51207  ORF Transcript_20031/g.51207 Transcript_20031/m.51207 type:complete len:643 (-) Transcript_20031:163-2091(-)
MPHAAIEQRVEDDSIRGQTAAHHLLEGAQRRAQVARLAVAADERRVRDGVRLATIPLHLPQQLHGELHVTSAGLRVDEGGVGHVVHAQVVLLQLAVHIHGSSRVAGAGVALYERRVHHRVGRNPAAPLLAQLRGLLHSARVDQRVEHATEGDVVGLEAPLLDHLPKELVAAAGELQLAGRLDQQAVRVHGGLEMGAVVGIEDLAQMIRIPAADAGVQHGVEEDVVLADVHPRAVQQGQRLSRLRGRAGLADRLHQYGDGVAVQGDAAAVHLAEQVPDAVQVAARNGRAQQAVERRAVGGDASGVHVIKHPPRAPQLALGAVAFDHGVVGDGAQQALRAHLAEDLLAAHHVAAHDAGVEHAVERDGVRLALRRQEAAQQGDGLLRVARLPRCADEPHVVPDTPALRPLEEGARQLRPATLHRELDEATVHDVVGLDAVRPDLVVEVAGPVVEPAAGVDLHEGLVRRQRRHPAVAEVGGDLVREREVMALPALGQQAAAEALASVEAVLLHGAEHLDDHLRVPVLDKVLQQGLIAAVASRLRPQRLPCRHVALLSCSLVTRRRGARRRGSASPRLGQRGRLRSQAGTGLGAQEPAPQQARARKVEAQHREADDEPEQVPQHRGDKRLGDQVCALTCDARTEHRF